MWKCKKCGARNSQRFCENCGFDSAAAPADPTPAPVPAHAGWICPNCRNANDEDDLFCIACGSKAPIKSSTVKSISVDGRANPPLRHDDTHFTPLTDKDLV